MMKSQRIEGPTAIPTYDGSTTAAFATASAAPLPPPMEYSGDMALELTALITKMAGERKKSGREARAHEEMALDKAEQGQIDDLRAKAHDLRSEGMHELGAGLVSAGFSAVSAGAGFAAASKLGGDGAATVASRTWDATGKGAEAAGIAASAGFKAIATADRADQVLDDAAAAADEHAASHAKRAIDDARDEIREGNDLGKKALEFYREFSSAQNQAQMAALHRS
jgi:hypothetical protein